MKTTLDVIKAAQQLISISTGVEFNPNHPPTLTPELLAVAMDAAVREQSLVESVGEATEQILQMAVQASLSSLQLKAHERVVQSQSDEITDLKTRLRDKDALITSLRAEIPEPVRNGKTWTESEEYYLVKYYREGLSESEIAKKLKRYGDAICVRLGKLQNSGEFWPRLSGESEESWTQRQRYVFFTKRFDEPNELLWHVQATTPGKFTSHVLQAFETVPFASRAVAKAA